MANWKFEIVEKIRSFEQEKGFAFFYIVNNIIDNVDFLKWLKDNYPNVYSFAETVFFYDKDPDGSFEEYAPKWTIDFMEEIVFGMAAYFQHRRNENPDLAISAAYYIIAEYISDRDTNVLLGKIEEAMRNS